MKTKLFKSIFSLTMLIFLVGTTVVLFVLYASFNEKNNEQLADQARIIAIGTQTYGKTYLETVCKSIDLNIVWNDADGRLIYDSHSSDTEKGDESQASGSSSAVSSSSSALSSQPSTASSGTASDDSSGKHLTKTINRIITMNNGSKLTVTSTQYTFFTLLYDIFQWIILAFAIAMVLSGLLASSVSKSLTSPINKIDLIHPDERDVYEEIQPLVRRINVQNMQIQRQMRELKEEHSKTDKLRREFTANVSHELKTPLTSISGYAEIMRNGLVKHEDIQRFSAKIYDEAQRLITLVGDIIKLSQLDEDEMKIKRVEVDLYDMCAEVLHTLDDSASKKDVTLNLKGEHISIIGIPNILNEVIYNLCDNAIKYNNRGGSVNVLITKNDDYIKLSVADTGIGIPQDEQDRVFERFYRVDKSHSKELGGTGLGLSIVKHGASYHNAKISVDSEIGKGTKITLNFPLFDMPYKQNEQGLKQSTSTEDINEV